MFSGIDKQVYEAGSWLGGELEKLGYSRGALADECLHLGQRCFSHAMTGGKTPMTLARIRLGQLKAAATRKANKAAIKPQAETN